MKIEEFKNNLTSRNKIYVCSDKTDKIQVISEYNPRPNSKIWGISKRQLCYQDLNSDEKPDFSKHDNYNKDFWKYS